MQYSGACSPDCFDKYLLVHIITAHIWVVDYKLESQPVADTEEMLAGGELIEDDHTSGLVKHF